MLQIDFNMDDMLYLQIVNVVEAKTNQEKKDRDELIDELPQRLRDRLSMYMFSHMKKDIDFFEHSSDDISFVQFITPKL